MSGKQAYRNFLKTDFWLELSARKKALVGRCERCGSTKRLQSHHIRYTKDWNDTALADLQVLCRKCHRKEHGIVQPLPFMVYRDDVRFSAFCHRTERLRDKLYSGRPLRDRDRRFLEMALATYPPSLDDSCMEFHVTKTYELERFMKANPDALALMPGIATPRTRADYMQRVKNLAEH